MKFKVCSDYSNQDLIELGNKAVLENKPNEGEKCFHTLNGVHYINSPLALILCRISNPFRRSEVDPDTKNNYFSIIKKLLKLDCDLFQLYPFFAESIHAELKYHCSCLKVLLSFPNDTFNDLIRELTTKQFYEKKEFFYEIITTFFRENPFSPDGINQHLNLLSLFNKFDAQLPKPSLKAYTQVLFSVLHSIQVSTAHSPEVEQLKASILRLLDEKFNFNEEPYQEAMALFRRCINDPSMYYKFILHYPDCGADLLESERLVDASAQKAPNYLLPAKLMRKGLGSQFFRLKQADLSGHNSHGTWTKPVFQIIEQGKFNLPEASPIVSEQIDPAPLLIDESLTFVKFVGRTIVMHRKEDDVYLAFKVQKKSENPKELEREYQSIHFLNREKNELGLESQLPEAQFYGTMSQDQISQYCRDQETSSFYELISQENEVGVYVYKVKDLRYFSYLHQAELPFEDFAKAAHASVNDLFVLLKQKGIVFHQLGDIFHNQNKSRSDQGRYLLLISLLRRHYEVYEDGRPGRVDRWQKAIEFVNLRATGIADVGDFLFFDEFYNEPYFSEITQPYLHDRLQQHPAPAAFAKEAIYANVIAEYLFVLFLICGKRGVELSKAENCNQDEIWQELADLLLALAAQSIAILTDLPEEEAQHYISTVNSKALAKQMQFWMTPDYSRLTNEEREARINAMYSGAKIKMGDDPFRTSIPGLGFANNGKDQDLGQYNAENPIYEACKLFYLVPTIILSLQSMKRNYDKALDEFKLALEVNDRENAKKALSDLRLNRYPKNQEQKKTNKACLEQYRQVFKEELQSMAVEHVHQTTAKPVPEASDLFSNKQEEPHAKVKTQASHFNDEQIQAIRGLIESLTKEIESCWPYPNKDRKLQKVNGLNLWLQIAIYRDIPSAIDEAEKQYPELREGIVSTRTADLLDNLRNEASNCTVFEISL